MSTAKTAAERVGAMRRRRYEAGLRMLTLWVPKERAAEVREAVRHVLAAPPGAPAPIAAAPPRERAAARWHVVLPPTSTPAALRKAMRRAGMACAAAGRWHGRLTPVQRQELDPLVQEAEGRWEKG